MKFKIKYQVSYELAILDGMCIYTYIYCLLFCLSLVEMSSCSIAIFRRVWSGWGAGVDVPIDDGLCACVFIYVCVCLRVQV